MGVGQHSSKHDGEGPSGGSDFDVLIGAASGAESSGVDGRAPWRPDRFRRLNIQRDGDSGGSSSSDTGEVLSSRAVRKDYNLLPHNSGGSSKHVHRSNLSDCDYGPDDDSLPPASSATVSASAWVRSARASASAGSSASWATSAQQTPSLPLSYQAQQQQQQQIGIRFAVGSFGRHSSSSPAQSKEEPANLESVSQRDRINDSKGLTDNFL
jgi:hypothetical protein